MRLIDADVLKANCEIKIGNDTIGRRQYVMFHEIDDAPTIGGWIPCSERLPEERKVVLITNDKGNVRYGQFRGTRGKYWHWKGNTLEEVIAWMELPEPYREDSES